MHKDQQPMGKPHPNARSLVEALQLQPHPEGGWYRETYRSPQTIQVPGAGGALVARSASTGIYFLLEAGNFSAFHRIRSDELWHFYAGDALEIWELTPQGQACCTRLGSHKGNGETFQHGVPAHHWFAARVAPGGHYGLVGCTVAPGFDFADFELADRAALQAQYPEQQALIAELTR